MPRKNDGGCRNIMVPSMTLMLEAMTLFAEFAKETVITANVAK